MLESTSHLMMIWPRIQIYWGRRGDWRWFGCFLRARAWPLVITSVLHFYLCVCACVYSVLLLGWDGF